MAGYRDGDLRQRGEVELEGAKLSSLSAAARAQKLAYLPQHPESPEDLDVYETIALARTAHRPLFAAPTEEDRRAIDAALERFELGALSRRKPRSLSGGERQRVHLARIMAQDAPVWLLDEPYGELDLRHQRALLRWLLQQCVEERRLIVVVAHDWFFLPHTASHVLLLQQGRALACGERRAVWTQANAERAFDARFDAQGDRLVPAFD